MPIISRNSRVVTSASKVAASCNCCGCPPCTPTFVRVNINSSAFLRQALLRNRSFPTNESKWSQLYVTASGSFDLSKVDGIWKSEELSIMGGGRITAVFNNAGTIREVDVRIPMTTIGALRQKGGRLPFEFLSAEELAAVLASYTLANQRQASGFIAARFRCVSSSGASTYKTTPSGWVNDYLVPPFDVCDFLTFQNFFSDSRVANKGTPQYLQPGFDFDIVSDSQNGSNTVTMQSITFDCNPLP
jgi:hypothetical protein